MRSSLPTNRGLDQREKTFVAPLKGITASDLTTEFPVKQSIQQSQRFALRHETPGVKDALETFPWLDPLVVAYHEHSADGAADSLKVGSMLHAYTKEHPEWYTTEDGLIVVAAGVGHDIGKVKVPKDDLDATTVYTPEERMQKLSKHVEEGFLALIGANTIDEIDVDTVDDVRRKTALIAAGHHLDQDDRGSYPPADTAWLQTDDPFVLQNRRVLIVADRVDALRTERSYKRQFTESETIKSLEWQGFRGEIVDFMLEEHSRQSQRINH